MSAVASADDKHRFEYSLNQWDLPEFTIENIRGTFGDYILNPGDNILPGLAEVFCGLDPFFRSHAVKIGVKGLKKRVILTGCSEFYGYGADRVRDVLNALAVYESRPISLKVI